MIPAPMASNSTPPDDYAPQGHLRGFARARQVLMGEFENISVGLLLASALVAPLPRLSFSRLRTGLYRAVGLNVGAGTIILGRLELSGGPDWHGRLRIGERCMLNTPLFIDLNDEVHIEDEVNIGHHVMLITSSHKVGKAERRAGMLTTAPIRLEAGCWVSAGVTILPGVTVGRGAVVAAGAVVAQDVPRNSLVGGVPAKLVKPLPEIP
jgi:maltose O-acetyltransferase